MPKRHRVRARARRPIDTARRPESPEAVEPARAERPARLRSRPPVAGTALATAEASPILERAAAIERGYVMKDVGRLGKVIAVMLALLVASGLAVDRLLR